MGSCFYSGLIIVTWQLKYKFCAILLRIRLDLFCFFIVISTKDRKKLRVTPKRCWHCLSELTSLQLDHV